MQHCVILGDVVDSRSIENRAAFRDELIGTLTHVNSTYEDQIHTPFETIKGIDEIGGVLSSVRPLAAIQRDISRRLFPEQVRLAAVVGDIDLEGDTISDLDGPALVRSDECLEELRTAGLTFHLEGTSPIVDDLLTAGVNLLDVLRGQWSDRTHEIIFTHEHNGKQKDVADELGIAPQTVSEYLHKPTVETVLPIEQTLIRACAAYPDNGSQSRPVDDREHLRDQ